MLNLVNLANLIVHFYEEEFCLLTLCPLIVKKFKPYPMNTFGCVGIDYVRDNWELGMEDSHDRGITFWTY
jgi:hypothetical protein